MWVRDGLIIRCLTILIMFEGDENIWVEPHRVRAAGMVWLAKNNRSEIFPCRRWSGRLIRMVMGRSALMNLFGWWQSKYWPIFIWAKGELQCKTTKKGVKEGAKASHSYLNLLRNSQQSTQWVAQSWYIFRIGTQVIQNDSSTNPLYMVAFPRVYINCLNPLHLRVVSPDNDTLKVQVNQAQKSGADNKALSTAEAWALLN